MSEEKPEDRRTEPGWPGMTGRAEPETDPNEYRYDPDEPVEERWRRVETSIYGFWKPAIVLLVLGALAILLAQWFF